MLKSRWLGVSADGGRREVGGKFGKWERGKVGKWEGGKGGWGEMLCPGEEKGLSITRFAVKKICNRRLK
jgi:hypothetical protein